MAELCERCWNCLANGLAAVEGATAPRLPTADEEEAEGVQTSGPATCRRCREEVRRYPTYYERWVDLEIDEQPAKEVPERYRWRLMKAPTPHAPTVIAVRVRVIDPLPSDPVIPAHAFRCPDEEAERQDLNP
ncbi:DUF6083 domain-containing protein [Streptomyces brasiliensis]|uniref:Uncharacterized protein n=1 Tax=Streptomyces brasiliensis TaxID=1954 RepID=A0A917P515_9ACTN|nr:DUF6083 domain-containing protein [Streptomyces brasiliensis]GGJ62138.1 hypothetical protein GCM10010121_085950 [Streptomyces brasiliensis]